MSGYESQPEGIQWLIDEIGALRALVNQMLGANGLESATITGTVGLITYDPATHARTQHALGGTAYWSDYEANPDNYGQIYTDPGSGLNLFRMFPPYSDGNGLGNSLTIQGRRAGLAGNMWLYTDGNGNLIAQDENGDPVGSWFIGARTITLSVDASSGGSLPLYGLSTTSEAANLHLGMVGGVWTVAWVTSGAHYKNIVGPAEIDGTEVLEWVVTEFVDKNDADALGHEAKVHRAFIADQIHSVSPDCVEIDDEDRPDRLRDREMFSRVVALCQTQQRQIDDLTARLEAAGL